MNTRIEMLCDNMEKVIIGKRTTIIKLITAMVAGGHVLLEDVPGVGKTKLAAALAKSVNGKFCRVQFTPDLMPSDIMGFSMMNPITKKFEYHEGACMCNFLLADEINRASPKVQSGLLEVMEEYSVSVDGETHRLPMPFMTIATENPVETYGTYHLPEAQMDRFIMRLKIGYPQYNEEISILDRSYDNIKDLHSVITLDDVIMLKKLTESIKSTSMVKQYILNIITTTRNNNFATLGASPRASIALFNAAKAFAVIHGRSFITPDDVKFLASDVLAHRIILSARGKAEYQTSENFINQILNKVSVPSASVV